MFYIRQKHSTLVNFLKKEWCRHCLRSVIINKKKVKLGPNWEGTFVIEKVYLNGIYLLTIIDGIFSPINDRFPKGTIHIHLWEIASWNRLQLRVTICNTTCQPNTDTTRTNWVRVVIRLNPFNPIKSRARSGSTCLTRWPIYGKWVRLVRVDPEATWYYWHG